MTIGLVGRKAGMTRVFSDAGDAVSVTVIEALPNRIVQLKDVRPDGYRAIQVTFGTRRASRITKPAAGHYAKPGVLPGTGMVEFRLAEGEGAELKAGAELKVDMFEAGQVIDVTGTTVGKGYAGVMKRHGFAGGYASHGNSVSHRSPGSIGQRQTPGRVFPGKRMAGHLGAVTKSGINLEVVSVDAERNLLLVKGAVPGPKGQDVIIRPSVKTKSKAKPVAAAKK
ncbi:MAG: 50S ribosomal protein L3 [Candidatus Muproteobacteria bacterium RBG_16_62_13]|uniref:Large ribosomal subunit protein uL3 n=1 Tax=Candidatus Muproteobacteria bacterium RBG_16_62_13 TaxID=1817756 RepID=A0A1F6T7Q0_9PROT|nr:MAG: 50S ribosomal protein L3 [Candidatus Muproteobacteria bacterium RBG_16_62_13]